jgi:uncharacterized membrane-anchored protein
METVMDTVRNKGKQMLNKVPEITLYFWIIKVLCTTVGETVADFLNTSFNLGLTGTSLITALIFQFKSKRYKPGIYWLSVVLVSVVGTLISDNLTDNFGISLTTTTILFFITTIVVFVAWYMKEKTLSIHSIFTRQRESFYWLAILSTFALGTAAGDLLAEGLNLGCLLSIGVFAAAIAVVALAHYRFKLNGVLSFWMVYILTRPLGVSIGDYLSSAHADGGLGLGTTITSALFLLAILGTVVYLAVTKKDVATKEISA